MTTDERTNILAELYRNILLFCVTVLPHHFSGRSADFQYEICSLLKKKQRLNCIVAPRDHAKSTLITLGFVLYKILFHECNFAVIISDTEIQAKMFLDAVKNELETNEIIKLLFGNFIGPKWGETDIITGTGIRIICKGAGQKIRGLKFRKNRPDLVIIDDLENDELVESQERRDKLSQWFFKTVLPALVQEGQLVYVGTILHYDSLLNKLIKNPQWNRLFYRAIMKDKALWETRYNLEQLDKIKANYAAQGLLDAFMCEYLNEPVSDENAIFKQKYFKYYRDDEALINSLSKFITVDLAISKSEEADYTVVMVSGVDAIGQIYILEYVRERCSPIETIEHIFRLAGKWNVSKIGIEGVAYQRALQWFLEDEMRRRNEYYLVEELVADSDKERRIKGLQPRYAVGGVFHKSYMTDLEEELLRFPKGAHDDLADCVAYIPQIAFPGQGLNNIPRENSDREQALTRAQNEPASEYSSWE